MKRFISLLLVAVLILAMTIPVLAERNDKTKEPNPNKPVSREDFNSSLTSLLEEYGYSWEPTKGKGNVTREELVMILGKLLIDEDIIDISSMELSFKDIKHMDKNTKEKLIALFNEGIIKGKTKQTFNPNSKVTYGELKAVLERIRKILEQKGDKWNKKTIPFKQLKTEISYSGKEGVVVKEERDKVIVSVTKEFGSPGYDLKVNKIRKVGSRYEIDLSIIPPDEDTILPTVVTYLTANIEIDKKYLGKSPYRFYVKETVKDIENRKEIPFKQLKTENTYSGKEGIVVKEDRDRIYLTVTKEFPTPGYAMAVEKIVYEDGEYKVHLIIAPPQKGTILPQVISYRTIHLEILKDDMGKPPYNFIWEVLPILL
ncbi:exported hypothetical protein [[Clostridium] ultunense Esp]|uniref:SLH domain-containing protein n=1 Tax=[Clostridium] ultunense Esp TaxID=1288971 RepID=M1YRG0_9FIRM|nr:S-layer homology domain-containing protein [Schnuerera ultunensis]CCQ93150.1 exported hypothetical protein [[Clostridium] ultunense Esp]SHD76416.1 conserved exported protein of unknown function [[Clostridium] ultunense Esp]